MPFGDCIGWELLSIAEKRPVTFCKLVRKRRKYYGDFGEALAVLNNGAAHKAAKAEKQRNDKQRKNRDLLENSRY